MKQNKRSLVTEEAERRCVSAGKKDVDRQSAAAGSWQPFLSEYPEVFEPDASSVATHHPAVVTLAAVILAAWVVPIAQQGHVQPAVERNQVLERLSLLLVGAHLAKVSTASTVPDGGAFEDG